MFKMRESGMNKYRENDIVVTGLSGRFPESETVEEFAEKLFAGVDLVTEDDRRWTPGLYGLPKRSGKLKELRHFDAPFFGVHAKQAHLMDPQLRLLLEVTYECIVDAGFNPAELRGSRTGVYVGVSSSETEECWNFDIDKINGYARTGCSRAMFSNRVSYSFDFKGPSFAIDTTCSSSLYAMTQAVSAIRAGIVDAAIVAGTNICLKPAASLNLHRLHMLSPEGRCATFDASGDGYVRSEAVVAVLVQRRCNARRVYATVRGANANIDGYKEQGITFPVGAEQQRLAVETFEEAGLNPRDVAYFEAHGTGTRVGDPQEVNAVADLFCKGRTSPLLIGSVKSNMGHTEAASGLCSIAKVILAMNRRLIPANLHYSQPNSDIPALVDGRIKVVDCNTEWEGGVVAVNSFGSGGANAHVILESEIGERPSQGKYSIPRLVLASGRTEHAARTLLEHAARNATDAELHALIDSVHALPVHGHPYRAWALLPDVIGTSKRIEVERISEEPRPLWLLFPGMGSQWPGMARELMSLSAFSTSMRRSAAVLEPYGVDLLYIVSEAPSEAFDDVVATFVAITAVQVALVDVLRTLGLQIDGIIGISAGEIACAYADEALTAEQAVLTAYWRGRSVVDARVEPGAMAAVGLTWEECKARCPLGVVPACHNAVDSVTVSGKVAAIEAFVTELKSEGIFAMKVKSCGVAFHSENIACAAPLLRESLLRVIPKPRLRSACWLSTSVPRNRWDDNIARLSDADYYVNNLVSQVWFLEALREVPQRALIVEVAPHGTLQAILKRELPQAVRVPLMRYDAPSPLAHFLGAIGRIYAAGAQPHVAALYPSVRFPVTSGTPSLASYVHWNHSVEWSVANFTNFVRSRDNIIEVNLSCADYTFLEGNEIDGRKMFPASGYLTLIWHTFTKSRQKNPETTAVIFEDIRFKNSTILKSDTTTKLLIEVFEGTGEFVISEGAEVKVTGIVRFALKPHTEGLAFLEPTSNKEFELDKDYVYNELRHRGYNYSGSFCGIQAINADFTEGEILWDGNWMSFIDSMLQFNIIGLDTRQLFLPIRLQQVLIDPTVQSAAGQRVRVVKHHNIEVVVAGGVELRGLKLDIVPRNTDSTPSLKLERHLFMPYDGVSVPAADVLLSKRDSVAASLQILVENMCKQRLKICEVALERPPETLLTPIVLAAVECEPQLQMDVTLAVGENTAAYYAFTERHGVNVTAKVSDNGWHCIVAADVISRHGAAVLKQLASALLPDGMLLLEENTSVFDTPCARDMLSCLHLDVISRQTTGEREYLLLKRRAQLPAEWVVIEVSNESYEWMDEMRAALNRAAKAEELRVYVVSRVSSGVLGLAAYLRREPGGKSLRVYYLPGTHKPFSPDSLEYCKRVHLDLAVNVLRAGVWGSYRYLKLNDETAVVQVEHAYVDTMTTGNFSSLRWIESDLGYAYETWKLRSVNQALCRVSYAAVNFHDIMIATGQLPSDCFVDYASNNAEIGLEFSGRTTNGKRVMGLVSGKALATTVLANDEFMWEVPKTWSLEEAATVPLAYVIAYYGLIVRGGVQRGETVLIHDGSADIGLAAIALALHTGCTVYTTVNTSEKRTFLQDRFPKLLNENIGNLDGTNFEQMVMESTSGHGVDLILNLLGMSMLRASMRCLAIGGRFVQVGQLDLSKDTKLDVGILLRNTTFHTISLSTLFNTRANKFEKDAIWRCLSEGIRDNVVQPLPATVFSERELEPAFQCVKDSRYIGKVIVRVQGESAAPVHFLSAVPRTYMNPDKSYVLVTGLEGFELDVAQWLVRRGARKLILNSQYDLRNGYKAWFIRRWQNAGVQVEIGEGDVTNPESVRSLLNFAHRQFGPVGGIFYLDTASSSDILPKEQTTEQFKIVSKQKIDATKVLDMVSRELTLELDHFVVFSSITSGRASSGQSSYGFANSAMERIVEQRQADGLPGMAIQWGAIYYRGSHMESTDQVSTAPQSMASCMEAFDKLLTLPYPVASSTVLPEKRIAVTGAVNQDITHTVANILGIIRESVCKTATMSELGMDSLLGAEIKEMLARRYEIELSIAAISTLTLNDLHKLTQHNTNQPFLKDDISLKPIHV